MDIKKFFMPNVFKVYLTLLGFLPVTAITISVTEYSILTTQILVWMILSCIMFPVTYLVACILNYILEKTDKRWVKILVLAVATVLTLGATLILFLILNRPPIVCDPVHDPMVCDPVHEPFIENTRYTGLFGTVPAITKKQEGNISRLKKQILD